MWTRLTNQIVGDLAKHQKDKPLLIARLLNHHDKLYEEG